jgi:hypothetical protein
MPAVTSQFETAVTRWRDQADQISDGQICGGCVGDDCVGGDKSGITACVSVMTRRGCSQISISDGSNQ